MDNYLELKADALKVKALSMSAYFQYRTIRNIREVVVPSMKMLGFSITNRMWAIGGSAAFIVKGVSLGRMPHDIDIIVEPGMYNVLKEAVQKSPFFRMEPCSSSSDEFGFTEHFAFRTQCGLAMDIISCTEFGKNGIRYCTDLANVKQHSLHNATCGAYLIDMDTLILSKASYGRPKDKDDLAMIEKQIGLDTPDISDAPEQNDNSKPMPKVERETLGDLDALRALKEEYDKNNKK